MSESEALARHERVDAAIRDADSWRLTDLRDRIIERVEAFRPYINDSRPKFLEAGRKLAGAVIAYRTICELQGVAP